MPTDDEERYRRHLRDIGAEDDPELRRAWEEEDARNRQQEPPGGRGWQDQFGRARDEWEQATRRTGEWDRWDANEREQQFAQHAQRLGYGSQEDLQDYLSGKSPKQEKGTYDDLMGRIADARAARDGGFYQVKPGDTLSQIAQRFGLDVEDLVKWNPRPDRNLLRVGEVITLPAYKEAKTPPVAPTAIPQGGLLGRPPEAAPAGHWQDEAIPMPPVGSAEWLRWLSGPKTRRVWNLAGGFLGRPMSETPPISPRFGEDLAPIGTPGASEDDTARQLERMFTGQIAETPQTGLLEGLTAAGEAAYLPSQALAYLASRLTGGPEEWSPESTEWSNILPRWGVPEGEGRPMTPEERVMAALQTGAVSREVIPETAPPSARDLLAAFLQYGPGDPLNYPLAAFTAPGRLLTRGAAGLAERAAARGGRAAAEAAEALAPGARRLAAGEAGYLKPWAGEDVARNLSRIEEVVSKIDDVERQIAEHQATIAYAKEGMGIARPPSGSLWSGKLKAFSDEDLVRLAKSQGVDPYATDWWDSIGRQDYLAWRASVQPKGGRAAQAAQSRKAMRELEAQRKALDAEYETLVKEMADEGIEIPDVMAPRTSVQTGLPGVGPEAAQARMLEEFGRARGTEGQAPGLLDREALLARERAKPQPSQAPIPEAAASAETDLEQVMAKFKEDSPSNLSGRIGSTANVDELVIGDRFVDLYGEEFEVISINRYGTPAYSPVVNGVADRNYVFGKKKMSFPSGKVQRVIPDPVIPEELKREFIEQGYTEEQIFKAWKKLRGSINIEDWTPEAAAVAKPEAAAKQPWEMTVADRIPVGSPSRRPPTGAKWLGEVYESDYRGPTKKPIGVNSAPMGNVYRMPDGTISVLSPNEGMGLPGVYDISDFESVGTLHVSANQEVPQYVFRRQATPDLAAKARQAAPEAEVAAAASRTTPPAALQLDSRGNPVMVGQTVRVVGGGDRLATVSSMGRANPIIRYSDGSTERVSSRLLEIQRGEAVPPSPARAGLVEETPRIPEAEVVRLAPSAIPATGVPQSVIDKVVSTQDIGYLMPYLKQTVEINGQQRNIVYVIQDLMGEPGRIKGEIIAALESPALAADREILEKTTQVLLDKLYPERDTITLYRRVFKEEDKALPAIAWSTNPTLTKFGDIVTKAEIPKRDIIYTTDLGTLGNRGENQFVVKAEAGARAMRQEAPQAEVARPVVPVEAVPAKLTRAQQQLLDAEMLKRGAEKGPIGESGYVRYEGEGEQAVMRAVPQAEVDEAKRVLFAPETEAIDLTGRTILEPPPSAITPELVAQEIAETRRGVLPEGLPSEAIPDPYATSWNNMPVERRATLLRALGRDEGLATSSWETIAQTQRDAIIEGVERGLRAAEPPRKPPGEWQLDDAVALLERKAAEAGTTLTEIPAPLAGAGGGKGGRHKGPPPPRPKGGGAPTGGTEGGLPGAAADLLFGYPGESNRTAIGRQFGGQRTAAFLRITAEGMEGQNVLAQAVKETGQKVIRRAGDRNFNGVVFDNDDLMRALHGEGPVPVGYEKFYDWAKAAVKAEEDRMVLVDPDFARYIEANPDYFYRAWQLPKGDKDWPTAWRRLGFGDEPGFLKERVKPSYTQMREWGFEPLSRNPVDMIVLRRIAGEERRLLLVTRQKLEAARLIMPASEAPNGWRVPRNIGTLFTGTAEQPAMAVPNYVANVLERVFHVRPSGKGWTIAKAVVDFQDTVKQYKFLGSLFQHFDFLFRTGYVASTLTGIRNLAPLKYIPLGTRLMTVRALKSSQRALKREIMSGEPLYEDFPITGQMLVEEGLSIRGDPTMLARPMLESYQKVLAQGGVPPGWKQLAKARGNSVKNFTVDWLFEGVYPESQWWALKNFVIPKLRAMYPNWTPRQIAGLAATETNKMFSTIAPFQSWFKSPEAFEVSRLFLFSGELEAWTRQAGSIFKGPAKRLWGEYHLGMFVFLAAVANVLNFWAEGKFIPPEDYSPIKVGDRYSPWPGGIAYNTRWFAPKIAGAVGEAGRPLYLDIVGQADTVLRWVADPIDGTLSRANVFWQAARRQLEGKTFWGQKLDTLQERAGALLQDVGGPIGPSNIGDVLRQQYPDLPFPLPASGEPRIGVTGSLIQATGFNVRAARNDEMLNEIAQRFYGRNWNELTLPERRKKEVAGEAEAFLPPKGGGVDYLDTLYGRTANYWDRADAIYEGYRKRLQEVPIGQSFDRTKITDARQQALNNLKTELKLSDDDLYGERPFATGRTSLTDIIMWIIRQGENVGRAVGAIPPEEPTSEPHYEAMDRTLAQSPPMLEAWLRGLQPGTLGPLPIGQRIPAIKGENEDFSQNEKQMFRRMSDVYWAIPDNIKDRNNIINWDLSSERQDQFLRALPEPMRERFYQYLKRNQSPGDMVRDIYQEWIADYYNVKGATPQETSALRQQWLVGHPSPNASDIAVDILHRYGYRFTEKEEEVDHPRKYHVSELSDALAGLNLPDIDEYQRRTNAQKVLKLQETGQGFYATSGIFLTRDSLPEYLKAQQWLEETQAQREAWKASEGLRNQRDGLYAYRDQLRETYNAIHDNPDISLDDRQAAYVEYKANRESVSKQLASIRARIPTYPIWPDYVAKYFSAPPSGQDREQWAAMAEAGNIPDTRAARAQSVDAAIFQIFETMPSTEKGATAQQVRDWWSQNEARLRQLGYRPEPNQEEIGKIWDAYWELKDKGQTREASAYLDQAKSRLTELGYQFKDGTTQQERTPEQNEISQIWDKYYGLKDAGKTKEAYAYLDQIKPRLAELGYVFKNGETPTAPAPSTGAYPGDALTTKGTDAWREEFEQVHGRPPNEIDYKDMLWSLQFLREKGRPPARVDWERNYNAQVRARTRPYSRTPEFVGGRERTLTNTQWRSVQDLLGRTGVNELIGSRFDSDRMSADARNTLLRYYRDHPYGARNFSDWLFMARNAFRREELVPA